MTTVESSKLDRLRHIVRGYGSALVAFSGGADSALVLKVAADELGARARALTAVSPTMARREKARAVAYLSSHFPYGTEITPERLAQIDDFEEGLYALGFRQLRVRYHDAVARLELEGDALPLAVEKRGQIVALGKRSGFTYVALDLEG